MTTIEQHAQQYLYDLNSITRKIHQDIEILQKNQTEDWEDVNVEKQEALLDQFFIEEAVRQKYAADSTDREEDPTCFPKYVVNCGEKIVIDFDNDGWTWRDEHSAPFSWMSRSQQDLRFMEDEEEDEGIEKDKKRKRATKSRSPEPRPGGGKGGGDPGPDGGGPPPNLAFKPEKSIWESPFLAADRGLDSAYPSSHASAESRTSDESDDLSQKLAASLSVSIDEDVASGGVDSQLNSPSNHNDTSVLLDSGNHKTIDLSSARLDLSRKGSGSSEESTSSRGSSKQRKKESSLVAKLWNPLKRKDETAAPPAVASPKSDSVDSGQVSPVYLEDPGESSSDFATPSTSTTQSSMTTFTFSTSAREEGGAAPGPEEETPSNNAIEGASGQTSAGLDDSFQSSEKDEGDVWKSDLFSTDTKGAASKTGFDFLDNW